MFQSHLFLTSKTLRGNYNFLWCLWLWLCFAFIFVSISYYLLRLYKTPAKFLSRWYPILLSNIIVSLKNSYKIVFLEMVEEIYMFIEGNWETHFLIFLFYLYSPLWKEAIINNSLGYFFDLTVCLDHFCILSIYYFFSADRWNSFF